jgi:Protein of unknown function (DUF3617)
MKTTVVVALAVLTGVTVALAQSPVRAGRWETAVQMQMAGSPIQMPEMKNTRCITPEEAKDPATSLPSGPPQGRGGKSDCKMADYKQTGNTAVWKMVCTSPQAMTINGEMSFTDDSYTGTMKMDSPQGPMTMKMSGKRLGDCTK